MIRGCTWEYHERGGWKAMPADINRYLEEQYLLGSPTPQQFIDPPYDFKKYVWNFPEYLQYREHYKDGQWVTVKTRSIRRIRVLDAPERPRG